MDEQRKNMMMPSDRPSPSDVLKIDLSEAIIEVMHDFKLSQSELAKRSGLDPSAVSLMVRGDYHRVGIPALIHAFNRLGGTVEVDITSPESLPAPVQAAH